MLGAGEAGCCPNDQLLIVQIDNRSDQLSTAPSHSRSQHRTAPPQERVREDDPGDQGREDRECAGGAAQHTLGRKLVEGMAGGGIAERWPILLSSDGLQKLMMVPKLAARTGALTGRQSITLRGNGNIVDNIIGRWFDTTASHT